MGDLGTFAETRAVLLSHESESEREVLGWCPAQPSGTLRTLLSVLVAGWVDFVHEKGGLLDRRRRDVAGMASTIIGEHVSITLLGLISVNRIIN